MHNIQKENPERDLFPVVIAFRDMDPERQIVIFHDDLSFPSTQILSEFFDRLISLSKLLACVKNMILMFGM